MRVESSSAATSGSSAICSLEFYALSSSLCPSCLGNPYRRHGSTGMARAGPRAVASALGTPDKGPIVSSYVPDTSHRVTFFSIQQLTCFCPLGCSLQCSAATSRACVRAPQQKRMCAALYAKLHLPRISFKILPATSGSHANFQACLQPDQLRPQPHQ